MTNIPENLIKFKAGTWWAWRAGHRVIPLLCYGFVRKSKAASEGFKLLFAWQNADGVLVRATPKWPARLEPIPEGEGSFDWEPEPNAMVQYRPFAGPDEYQQFAEYWLVSMHDPLTRYRVVEIDKYGIRFADPERVHYSWKMLFERYYFVGGPWKPVGMLIQRRR